MSEAQKAADALAKMVDEYTELKKLIAMDYELSISKMDAALSNLVRSLAPLSPADQLVILNGNRIEIQPALLALRQSLKSLDNAPPVASVKAVMQ